MFGVGAWDFAGKDRNSARESCAKEATDPRVEDKRFSERLKFGAKMSGIKLATSWTVERRDRVEPDCGCRGCGIRIERNQRDQYVIDLEVENKGLRDQVVELTKQRNEWQELALSRGYQTKK